MIERVREEHPEMPIEKLCELMGVNRSWYYARPPATEKKARKDVVLRDAYYADRVGVSRLRIPPGDCSAQA